MKPQKSLLFLCTSHILVLLQLIRKVSGIIYISLYLGNYHETFVNTLVTEKVMYSSVEQTKQWDNGVKENSSFINKKCNF